jgi:MazG family protein
MAVLRSPRGCPWDREQTHQTLRGYLIEECYEAVDAIDRFDLDALEGELGDVLLQCVFHAQLADEAKRFTIVDVIEAIAGKLISRHPHVFTASGRPLSATAAARRSVRTPSAVRERWSELKAREQASSGASPRLLAGVPRALPALLRAHKIGGRAATVGFDWPNASEVLTKVDEELGELREALSHAPGRAAEELGDLLFAIASLARKLAIDPEHALQAANDKFTARFDRIEAKLGADGRSVHDASPAELEAGWQAVKSEEARRGRSRGTGGQSTSRARPSVRRSRA